MKRNIPPSISPAISASTATVYAALAVEGRLPASGCWQSAISSDALYGAIVSSTVLETFPPCCKQLAPISTAASKLFVVWLQ